MVNETEWKEHEDTGLGSTTSMDFGCIDKQHIFHEINTKDRSQHADKAGQILLVN